MWLELSIHAPRAGRDVWLEIDLVLFLSVQAPRPVRGATRSTRPHRSERRYFNPRAPCGARQQRGFIKSRPDGFQSTRPVRGATHGKSSAQSANRISIHAPRAGRDNANGIRSFNRLPISIHAPRAGRDQERFASGSGNLNFNPRAPCGARLGENIYATILRSISIHAPRAGRDSKSIQNYFTHFCDKRQFLDNFTQNAAF